MGLVNRVGGAACASAMALAITAGIGLNSASAADFSVPSLNGTPKTVCEKVGSQSKRVPPSTVVCFDWYNWNPSAKTGIAAIRIGSDVYGYTFRPANAAPYGYIDETGKGNFRKYEKGQFYGVPDWVAVKHR